MSYWLEKHYFIQIKISRNVFQGTTTMTNNWTYILNAQWGRLKPSTCLTWKRLEQKNRNSEQKCRKSFRPILVLAFYCLSFPYSHHILNKRVPKFLLRGPADEFPPVRIKQLTCMLTLAPKQTAVQGHTRPCHIKQSGTNLWHNAAGG